MIFNGGFGTADSVEKCTQAMLDLDCEEDRPVCDETDHGNLDILDCAEVRAIYEDTCE